MNHKCRFYFSLIFLSAIILPGCYSTRKSVERSKPNAEKIHWPEGYAPESAGFFVHNEIDIKAPPKVVWDILLQAEKWHEWYVGAKEVRISSQNSGKLEPLSTFSWKTMGQRFPITRIKEFEAPYRLSWETSKKSIRGYHAWLIIPTDEGCKVITSEAQHGFLTFMQKVFVPNKLRKLHDRWLEGLKRKAENEPK